MEPGMAMQKYNPEVPYEGEGFRVNSKVNELVDKLISNRQKMSNVVRLQIDCCSDLVLLLNKISWKLRVGESIYDGQLIGILFFALSQMSQHSGHTDSDGMISDMAEGSGAWRFSDDSDFGADGSGSGDGYSGMFDFVKRFLVLFYFLHVRRRL